MGKNNETWFSSFLLSRAFVVSAPVEDNRNDEADSLACLIGKGDSTKSTILNAVRWALAPSRSLGVEDQGFYQCDVVKPIVIEVAVRGLPDELTSTSKFGLFLTDKPGFEGATDPVDDGRQPCIAIRLTVADDLDPVWEVYKGDRAKRIGAGDRSLLGVSAIFGASDSSFTWARGSGLRRLLADEKEISAVAVNAPRRLNSMEGSALVNRGRRCVHRDAAGCARVGADGSRLRPRAGPRGFWAVPQETGADFAMSPWLLRGFRRRSLAVGFSELGKRRRCTALRADSACETAQKLQAGLACVEGCASKRVFRFCRRWSQAL